VLGGAWLVGYGIACLQSSPPHKLDFWISITVVAIVAAALGILFVLAVMYDWPGPLVSRLPGRHRSARDAAPSDPATVSDQVWTDPFDLSQVLRDASIDPSSVDRILGLPADERPAFTALWRHTADGFEASPLMNMANLALPGFEMVRGEAPQFRVGISISCEPIKSGAGSSEIATKLLEFRRRPPVSSLLHAVLGEDDSLTWHRRAGNGVVSLEALLVRDKEPDKPIASVLFQPAISGLQPYGRAADTACLWLHVDPGQVPADLSEWYLRFNIVSDLARAFAAFLADDLSLKTSDAPMARAGVMLQSVGPLTELVDTGDLASLPGAIVASQFLAFLIAEREGQPPGTVVRDLLTQLCDHSLHLADFEASLDRISVGETTDVSEPAQEPVNAAEADLDEIDNSGSTFADSLSKRFRDQWADDISLLAKLKSQPSYLDTSSAFRRSSELYIISKHGVRVPLEDTSIYLRIPHPDQWPEDSIPLHLEERWMDPILTYEWTSGKSFLDVFVAIADAIRSAGHWEGEQNYRPDATFEQLSDLLLYGVEAIRKGFDGVINRLFQIVGNDWVISEWELIDKRHRYQILFSRFDESDWMSHMLDKVWIDENNFVEAFGYSRLLIYNGTFEGKLPPEWKPPTLWPFKTVLDG
jgi:hypothetical protein